MHNPIQINNLTIMRYSKNKNLVNFILEVCNAERKRLKIIFALRSTLHQFHRLHILYSLYPYLANHGVNSSNSLILPKL